MFESLLKIIEGGYQTISVKGSKIKKIKPPPRGVTPSSEFSWFAKQRMLIFVRAVLKGECTLVEASKLAQELKQLFRLRTYLLEVIIECNGGPFLDDVEIT